MVIFHFLYVSQRVKAWDLGTPSPTPGPIPGGDKYYRHPEYTPGFYKAWLSIGGSCGGVVYPLVN